MNTPLEEGNRLPIGRRDYWIATLLFIATILLFWPVIHHEFITLDDRGYILVNPHVRTGLTWQNVGWAFTSYYGANWHPVTWLSHMIDCQIFGVKPGGHHIINVVLHAINTSLLFLVLRQLTGAIYRSALVAALFAVHPLHVESVAWVAERKDVLSAFFFFLTIWSYAKYVWSKAPADTSEIPNDISTHPGANEPRSLVSRSHAFYALSLLLFALGLMSKPMLVTTPFVLLLLDYWPLRRLHTGLKNLYLLLIEKIPFFALSVGSCVLTYLAQQHEGAVASVASVPLLARIQNALVSYVVYLEKIFWPAKLGVYYPSVSAWAAWQVWGSLTLLLGISAVCAAAIWLTRTGSTMRTPSVAASVATGWFWFLGMLVPVIGFVQVGVQARADRYTYLPSIGIFIAITWLIADAISVFNKRNVHTQAPLINTPLQRGVDPDPKHENRFNGFVPTPQTVETVSAPAHIESTPLKRGVNERWELCGLGPDVVFGLSIMVLTLLAVITRNQLHYWRDSETLYRHTLAVTGPNAIVHGNLGTALVQAGRLKEAEQEFTTAIQIKPDYAEALSDLGLVLTLEGRKEEAVPYLEKAIAISPVMPQAHYLLSSALLAQGKSGEAITELRAALELNPQWPAALNDLAWILATDADDHLRNGTEAVTLAEKACRLTEYRAPIMLGTLAAAYAEAGQFERAVEAAEKARMLAQSLALTNVAEKNAHLMQLYRAQQPYHESVR